MPHEHSRERLAPIATALSHAQDGLKSSPNRPAPRKHSALAVSQAHPAPRSHLGSPSTTNLYKANRPESPNQQDLLARPNKCQSRRKRPPRKLRRPIPSAQRIRRRMHERLRRPLHRRRSSVRILLEHRERTDHRLAIGAAPRLGGFLTRRIRPEGCAMVKFMPLRLSSVLLRHGQAQSPSHPCAIRRPRGCDRSAGRKCAGRRNQDGQDETDPGLARNPSRRTHGGLATRRRRSTYFQN